MARIYLYTVLGAVVAQGNRQGNQLPDGAVTLLGAPTPPTSNNAYVNVRREGAKGRKLSHESVVWGYDCNAWAMTRLPELALFRAMAAQKRPLQVDVTFWFPHSEIWTKAGEIKPLDPPNFLKLIIDTIAKYGSMDDSMFFQVNCGKRPNPPRDLDRRITDLTISYLK